MYNRSVPRLIDHAERDRVIAAAAWNVLTRDGVLAFSVRNVADEAGLATASLRRRFPTQDALRVYCLRLVSARVEARIGAITIDAREDPRGFALECLVQLLPLDAERRVEMEVFLALASLAPTNPAVRVAYGEAQEAIARICRAVAGGSTGGVEPDEVPSPRSRRLHALLDGLALHLVHQAPEDDTAWAVELLADELGDALTPSRRASGRSTRQPGGSPRR